MIMDITPFLNEHPGGPDVVVSVSGKDCTHDFEDVGHTDSARRMAQPYVIGTLEGYAFPESFTRDHLPTNQEVHELNESNRPVKKVISSAIMGAGATFACMAALYYAFVLNK